MAHRRHQTPREAPGHPSLQYPSQYTAQQSSSRQPNRRSLVTWIGIGVCSLVLVVSATMLIRYFIQIERAQQASQELRVLYHAEPEASQTPAATAHATVEPTAQPTRTPAPTASGVPVQAQDDFQAAWPKRYPGNEQMRIQERFTPLRQQNRDIVAWLTIEDVLDEPVFQRDNAFYLTHDATGAKNPTGALFLDEGCNLRTVPMQTVIHGHNMKEGAMFGSLKKYKVKDATFYRTHPYIRLDTLYESATYVIFAVAEINIIEGKPHYFPFWQHFNFSTYDHFQQYVSLAKEYSRIQADIDVQPGDRLLTLATCSSNNDELRLIIMARMLRPDEDTILLNSQIYSATAK